MAGFSARETQFLPYTPFSFGVVDGSSLGVLGVLRAIIALPVVPGTVILLSIIPGTVVLLLIVARSIVPGSVAVISVVSVVPVVLGVSIFAVVRISGLRRAGLLSRVWGVSAILSFVFPVTLVDLHGEVLQLEEGGRTGDGFHDFFNPEGE